MFAGINIIIKKEIRQKTTEATNYNGEQSDCVTAEASAGAARALQLLTKRLTDARGNFGTDVFPTDQRPLTSHPRPPPERCVLAAGTEPKKPARGKTQTQDVSQRERRH